MIRTFAAAALGALVLAQTGVSIEPLRTAPAEKLTVNPGFRDWTRATVAGNTLLAGNSSGRGGLFAVDMVTGKLKWAARPAGHSNPHVFTAPAVSGDVVVVPIGNVVMGLSLATGKELWRGPVAAQSASVATAGGVAFVLGDDRNFYALDAATGKEKWKLAFASFSSCYSVPVAADGTVYVSRAVVVRPADASRPADYDRYLAALDAGTGEERWRYPATRAGYTGFCHEQPIVTAGTIFAIAGQTLHAVNTGDGRQRWAVEVRRPVEGRERAVDVGGLVDAGTVLIGITRNVLIAFDKATGRTAWEIAGQYRETSPATAVAGRVLYFQGHPGASPGTPAPGGRLNALDLDTRSILWSFSRPTAEANWPFGYVTPVNGGLWVDSYQALVKLQ